MTWEYRRIEEVVEVGDQGELNDALEHGWEPYAVTAGTTTKSKFDKYRGRSFDVTYATFVHHLRRLL